MLQDAELGRFDIILLADLFTHGLEFSPTGTVFVGFIQVMDDTYSGQVGWWSATTAGLAGRGKDVFFGNFRLFGCFSGWNIKQVWKKVALKVIGALRGRGKALACQIVDLLSKKLDFLLLALNGPHQISDDGGIV
jgi:hypothetical protein